MFEGLGKGKGKGKSIIASRRSAFEKLIKDSNELGTRYDRKGLKKIGFKNVIS